MINLQPTHQAHNSRGDWAFVPAFCHSPKLNFRWVGLVLLLLGLITVPVSADPIAVGDVNCFPYPTLPQVYSYETPTAGWMGIAVVSETDHHVFLKAYDNATGQAPALHVSEQPLGTNFLVHQWGGGSEIASFETYTDEGPLHFQHLVDYAPGQGALVFDEVYDGNYGAVGYDCGLLRVWDANLEAGHSYELNLDSDAASGDQEIYAALLRTGGAGGWLARADALWETSARSNSGAPGHIFTVPTTGTYALVVFRNGYHNLDVFDSDYHFSVEDHGSVSTYVDLIVQTISPGSSPQNTAFDLDITIRNTGTATSGPCVTDIWVDGFLVCSDVATPAVNPGQSVQIPACAIGPFPLGSVEVVAEVDTNDDVVESDDTNNQKSRTIQIVQLYPDLYIGSVTPAEAVPYNDVDFAIEVINIGQADAPASETSFNLTFTNPCGLIPTPPIPAGSSVVVYCSAPGLTPGYHPLGATADASDLVTEQYEANNSINSQIHAQGPDLSVVDFSPRQITDEESFRFEFTVHNAGNTDMPTCYAAITNNGLGLFGPFQIPIVPAGQDVVVTTPLISPLPAGTAHIAICVDVENTYTEYYETNNCLEGDLDVLALQATVFPDGHGDYATIQSAIDGVTAGGTVFLAEGTFTGDGNRDLTLRGKNLTVRGTGATPAACVIDCQGSSGDPHRAFLLQDGESNDTVLSNLTLTNGWVSDAGGAIRLSGASPTLENLIFTNNRSHLSHGGALYAGSSSFLLNDCLFDDNRALGEPPAITMRGGAVYCTGTAFTVRMTGNTFVNNRADEAGAIGLSSGVALIRNSLFVDNVATQGTVDSWSSGVPDLACCNVWSNTGGDWAGAIAGQLGYEGNLSVDPLFCDPSGADYTLHADSPCAADNAGDCGQIGALGVGCSPSGQSVYLVLADGSGDFATIQAAINASATGDVIELGDGTFAGSGNRNLQFNGKDLVLRSQSGQAENCVIDCGGLSGQPNRGFSFVNTGESNAAQINHITLRYGRYSQGGAVSIVGASPTFTGCVFDINTATTYGGAVYANNSDSQFLDCRFTLNSATSDGAAAYLTDGHYTLTDCIFSGNNTAARGGGLMLDDCTATLVEDCLLYGNTGTSGGGGLCVQSSEVTLNSCTLDQNTATSGGGVYCDASTSLQVGSSCITGSLNGEGLFCETTTQRSIVCSNIWDNDDGDWVGPIATDAGHSGNLSVDPQYCDPGLGNYQLNIDSPLTEDNHTCGQVGAFGIGCGIQTFVVRPGGDGDYPTIQAAINASAWGDTIALADGVFIGDGNRDLHFDGKAVTLKSQSGNPELCIIDCNGSSSDIHRGIDFTAVDGPAVRIIGLTIRNAWKGYGGAIRMSGGSPTIETCIFEDNASNNGAAIAATNAASPMISNCIFRNNIASNAGGAIHTGSGASPTLTDCLIIGNTATWGGGGLYAYGPSSATFNTCLFVDNGSDHWGGAFHTQNAGGLATFIGCTFDGNHAPDGGIGFVRGTSHADIDNSILSNSTDGEAVYCDGTSDVTVSCSNVWGHADGDWVGGLSGQGSTGGNLSVDPEYCDPTSGLYTLASGSPCLVSGNDCGVLMGAFGIGCSGGAQVWQLEADGSGDFATIQAAVDASYHGDTIVLADGTYTGAGNRDVDLNGLQIRITSASEDATTCIIDCQGSESAHRRGFNIHTNEGPNTTVENLTIRNGWATNGGGIQIVEASPTVAGCRFVNNTSTNGGGIMVSGASAPYIHDCFFTGNSAGNAGAGLRFSGGTGLVEACHFLDNYGHWGGGGIYLYSAAVSISNCVFEDNSCHNYGSDLEIQSPDKDVTVTGCTFVGGTAPDGSVRVRGGSIPEFDRCLLAFSQQGQAIACDASSDVVMTCSNVFGNAGGDWTGALSGQNGVGGNFSADPLFCDPQAGDFHLQGTSPCLPGGNTCGQQIGALDEACRTTPVEDQSLPLVVTLNQNYPNPFNPSTTLCFTLPQAGQTSLRIYDVRGALVRTLVQDTLSAGSHSITWQGHDNRGRPVATGVYWYQLKTQTTTTTRKMMLLK